MNNGYDNESKAALFSIIAIVALGAALFGYTIRGSKLEGQCARECAPQDSRLTSYWDGWHCVCVDKGVQLDRRKGDE